MPFHGNYLRQFYVPFVWVTGASWWPDFEVTWTESSMQSMRRRDLAVQLQRVTLPQIAFCPNLLRLPPPTQLTRLGVSLRRRFRSPAFVLMTRPRMLRRSAQPTAYKVLAECKLIAPNKPCWVFLGNRLGNVQEQFPAPGLQYGKYEQKSGVASTKSSRASVLFTTLGSSNPELRAIRHALMCNRMQFEAGKANRDLLARQSP